MMTTIPPYGFRVRWSDEDNAFVATSPEFDGVSGIGDDPESAVREAQTALALALETFRSEGWTPPPPEKITGFSGQFRLRVPCNVHARLAQRAADDGVSLNSYVLSVLSAALGPVSSVPPIAGSRQTPTSRPTRTAPARPARK